MTAAPAILRDDQAASLRRLVRALGIPEAAADASPPPPSPANQPPPTLARTIAVASGKGGVGKTSICVNLSIALSRLGLRTTLLDGDLGLANADVLCGLTARGHIGQALAGLRTLDEIAVEAPGGFRLIPGAGGVSALADIPQAQLSRLIALLDRVLRTTDTLVIDCGAGVGRGVLGLLNAADLPVVVTTPEPTAIADAYALIKCAMAERRGEGRGAISLVVNQAKDEGEAVATAERIGAVSRRFLGAAPQLLGWVATDVRVARAVRRRQPFSIRKPGCRPARQVMALARAARDRLGPVEATQPIARQGFIARLGRSGTGL